MTRESTDKEGGREVVGRSGGDEDGMRRPMAKTKGAGAGFIARKMDHEPAKSPFHKVGSRESTRREKY